jgi:heterodisulfide reductase subunit A-like polyferredoxin
MTILEIMERANSRDTNLVVAFIKDAVMRIQSNSEENLKVNKQNITKNTRDYNLPTDLVALKSISILDTEDDNKYKRISRLSHEPNVTEDTSP